MTKEFADTTLCYIEKDGSYLMLLRNKKKNDLNEGKWIGVGGHVEPGETVEECLIREVQEETGVTLTQYEKIGTIYFISDRWENEVMHLFTASAYEGQINSDCSEGTLKWIPREKVMELKMWPGDFYFMKRMLAGEKDINMTLRYEGDILVEVQEN